MRITNTMMMNQTLNNVGKSKNNLADLENQMSTQKAITRPSDNPIVAIRALSLRSSLSEINQYLEHNIPDAESWYEITEGALDDMDGILTDIYQYCTQGASDEFTVNDRSAIIEVLQQYKDALYSECNTSFSDRYIFSGYKTDSSFTFQSETEADKNYSITQTFEATDLVKVEEMKNGVDLDSIDLNSVTSADVIKTTDYPETESYYALRLAYSGCKNENIDLTYTKAGDTTATTKTATAISQADLEAQLSGASIGDDEVYYVYDTGELILGKNVYDEVKTATDIQTTYEKDGFTKGDVRPEMYYDCVDITDPADPITYTHREEEAISYTVNFSQTLQVNTRGCDTLSTSIGRDIDAMCNALQAVSEVEEKIKKIETMQESGLYTSDDQVAVLNSMKEAAEQEYTYALDYMEDLFSNEMGRVKGYQETVDLQLADLGARETRLSLTKSRITEQQSTFEDLKSSNEDVDLEDAVINYSSASTLYQAALTAASDVVKQSLLNYI